MTGSGQRPPLTRYMVFVFCFLWITIGLYFFVTSLVVPLNRGPVENEGGQISVFTKHGLPEWMLLNKDAEILDVEAADGGLYILYWEPIGD